MTESPTVNKDKNVFEVVTLAALRSHQLLRGCLPRVEGSPKKARRALQEVRQGTVNKAEPTTE